MKTSNPTHWLVGHQFRLIDTQENFDMAAFITPPHTPGPPPHYHDQESELFLILDGEMEVTIEDESHTLTAGDSLVVPVGKVHTFRNATDRPIHWVSTWTPKGFGKFFADLGIDAREPDAQQQSVSENVIQNLIKTCSTYGMILAELPQKV